MNKTYYLVIVLCIILACQNICNGQQVTNQQQNKPIPSNSEVRANTSARIKAIEKAFILLGGYRSIKGSIISGDNVSASDISDVQSGPRLAAELFDKGNSLPDVVNRVSAKYPKLTLIITPQNQTDYLEVERLIGKSDSTEEGSTPVHKWFIFGWLHIGVSENKVIALRVVCSSYIRQNN
jgi:hypothetical protein